MKLFKHFTLTLLVALVSITSASAENYILYTSSDGKIVEPYNADRFGANIISNTYENGQGKLLFDGEVTLVGGYAFYQCSNLKSIVIPNSVISIGISAFNSCFNLSSIEIPNTVTSIGECAFASCTKLTSVVIPDSVISIGEQAFASCIYLTSVKISSSVTSINDGTFTGCARLKSVVIPNSVTSIGKFAFDGCTSLKSIDIPNSVTDIELLAFRDCTALPVENGIRYAGPYIVGVVDKSLTSYNIKDGTRFIPGYTFYGCSSLTSIDIPNSVISIGEGAFNSCSSLTSVEIPNSVTTIGDDTFNGCSNLTSVVIPNSVVTIGNNAFDGCTSLKSVKIPNTVTSIGASAFSRCYALPVENGIRYADTYAVGAVDKDRTSFTIKNGTRFIGTSAFYNCSSLTSIQIPNSVISIGDKAFQKTGLTTVTLPESVTYIGEYAFYNCDKLTSINISNSVTSIGEQAFGKTKLSSVEIPNSVTSIGKYAFINCSSLKSVVIPSSVTSIGHYAFVGCVSLPVENGIRYADTYAVEVVDRNQSSYIIKDGTRFIGSYAFSGCSNLTAIEIPNTVISIGQHAFNSCSSLKTIEIPNSVNSIENDAFCDCSKLVSVELGNSINMLGESVFYSCSDITTIKVNNPNPIRIDNKVFIGVNTSSCILYVPFGCKNIYSIAEWASFKNIQEFFPVIDIIDTEPFTNIHNKENIIANYIRNFKNTNWQPLYLPFPMKYEDWADKAEVAYISNVHQYDDDEDGEVDRTILEFIKKTSGSIEPNKPYVIKPKQTGDITFTSENTTLYAAPETDGFIDCRSTTTEYTLYGTYQEKTDMYEKGYYAMANGGFKQAESASVKLSPFRTYLKIENRIGAGAVQNAKRINIMVDGIVDNDATGIEEITQNSSLETQNCYNLSGQKVNRGYKGIAIKNGKKYIIK